MNLKSHCPIPRTSFEGKIRRCKSFDNMTSTPVVLILGSGPRVGASVAKYFAENDYKVAIASRKCSNDTDINGVFSLQADLSKLESIPALFRAVKDHFQADPSVVVYNAAALTPPPDQSSMFSISPTSITNDLRVNTISAYVAAQEAVKAWDATPNDTKKTFIYTGNMQNVAVVPVVMMMNLGIGKSASASWIGLADINYAQKGYRSVSISTFSVDLVADICQILLRG